MDLDQLIVTVFCQIDDAMKTCLNNQNLRQRGLSRCCATAKC